MLLLLKQFMLAHDCKRTEGFAGIDRPWVDTLQLARDRWRTRHGARDHPRQRMHEIPFALGGIPGFQCIKKFRHVQLSKKRGQSAAIPCNHASQRLRRR